MSSIKGSLKYVVVALIFVLILSACERPLQSDEGSESEATEVVATSVVEEGTSAEQEEEAALEGDEASADPEEAEAEHEEEEGEVEAEHEDSVEEGEAEHEDEAAGEAESEAESPRPAEDEEEAEAEVPEEAESATTDPDVGGGTPDMVEEPVESEDGEEAEDVESADEPEAETDEPEAETDEPETETDEPEEAETDETTAETDEAGAAAAAGEESADTEASTQEAEATTQSTLPATHTVQAGENLYRIGLQYGISWVTLARYNNISNPNYISAGQVLQIPGGGTTPPPQPTLVPPVTDPPNYINYTVKPGDTLGKIGRAFGVSSEVIAEVNGIVNPNLIYAGQVLKIPTSTPETPPAETHVVQQGETLNKIAVQYGVHWLAIAQANNIYPPYVIYAGQTLVIPGG